MTARLTTHLRHRGGAACGVDLYSGGRRASPRLATRDYDAVSCGKCRRTRLWLDRSAEGHWPPEDYTCAPMGDVAVDPATDLTGEPVERREG